MPAASDTALPRDPSVPGDAVATDVLPRPALWHTPEDAAFAAYKTPPLAPIGVPRGHAILGHLRALDTAALDAACRDTEAPHLHVLDDTAGIAAAEHRDLFAYPMGPAPCGAAQRLVLATDHSGVIARRARSGGWVILPVIVQVPSTLSLAGGMGSLVSKITPAGPEAADAGALLVTYGVRPPGGGYKFGWWLPVLSSLPGPDGVPASRPVDAVPLQDAPGDVDLGGDILRAAAMVAARMPDNRLELPAALPFLPWHGGVAMSAAQWASLEATLGDFALWILLHTDPDTPFGRYADVNLTLDALSQGTKGLNCARRLEIMGALGSTATEQRAMRKALRAHLLANLPVPPSALVGQTWSPQEKQLTPKRLFAKRRAADVDHLSAHARRRIRRRFGPWPVEATPAGPTRV